MSVPDYRVYGTACAIAKTVPIAGKPIAIAITMPYENHLVKFARGNS